MATYDEILDDTQNGNSTSYPKGSQLWAENHNGDDTQNGNDTAGVSKSNDGNTNIRSDRLSKAADRDQNRKIYSLDNIIQILSPYKPPTQEEVEKEKKRQKVSMAITALGEGLTAMSNLFFTTRGAPSMYEAKDIAGKNKIRYDRLMQENKKNAFDYANLLWKIKHDKEYREDKRRAFLADLAFKQEEKEQKQQNFEKELGLKRELGEERNRIHKDANAISEKRNKISSSSSSAKSSAGTSTRRDKSSREVFINSKDKDNKPISIDKGVWRNAVLRVYDILVEDLKDSIKIPRHKTRQDKEDFVQQNWHKSPAAIEEMQRLAEYVPEDVSSAGSSEKDTTSLSEKDTTSLIGPEPSDDYWDQFIEE